MFRRFRKGRAPAEGLSPQELATLTQANQLMEQGKPAAAGPLFAQLAQALQASQHPRRAGNLHARAAHAFAEAGAGPAAVAQARGALNLFLGLRMAPRAAIFYTNLTRKMTNHGLAAAAEELRLAYSGQISALPEAAPAPARRGTLPTHCPKCGAPLRGDEVSWMDERTAECDYCGSPVRAES